MVNQIPRRRTHRGRQTPLTYNQKEELGVCGTSAANTEWVHVSNAQVKSRMLTTLIRSVITYGLENCDLSSGLIYRIRSTEANILKNSSICLDMCEHHQFTEHFEFSQSMPISNIRN